MCVCVCGEGASGVRDGGGGAEYAAGGNEHQRQLPKRVTNHPRCPNPPMGDLMDQWSQCVAAEIQWVDTSNIWTSVGFKRHNQSIACC